MNTSFLLKFIRAPFRTRLAGAFIRVAVGLLLASGATAQVSRNTAAEFWNNPTFVNQFLGSYGVDSEIEPTVSPEERKFFKDLIEEIKADPARAAATLKRVLTPESSAALVFTLGNLNVQLSKLDDAAQNYREAIRRFPSFRRAHKNLAIVLVQRGEHEEAAQELTRSLELGGGDAFTYGLLGYCHLSLEKYASAESAYRRATLLNPGNNDWQLGLARALLAQQKTKEAVALLDELIQKDPEKVDYWFHQANAYLELGETRRAADNYEIVRRMGKATGASLMALGDIYMSEDLRDLALAAYLESMDKQVDQDVKRPLRAAEIMASRQEWDKTATILSKIKDQYKTQMTEPDRLKILKLESKLALARGQESQAVATLEQIITKDPLDGEAILILANHYATSGDFDRAELLFDRAEKLRDHEVTALTQHAQALVARSKYDKAAKLLQRAQSLRPRDAVAKYLEQVERLAKVSGS